MGEERQGASVVGAGEHARGGRIIVGVDPGSRIAGFAFLRAQTAFPTTPDDFGVIDAGVLRADISQSHCQRVAVLHEALHELIHHHQPAVMVLEKAFVEKNVGSALKLGETRGAFMAAAGRSNVAIEEVAPAHVKKMITGNGRADKEQVSLAIKSLIGYDRGKLPHDVTDSVAIALAFGLGVASRELYDSTEFFEDNRQEPED